VREKRCVANYLILNLNYRFPFRRFRKFKRGAKFGFRKFLSKQSGKVLLILSGNVHGCFVNGAIEIILACPVSTNSPSKPELVGIGFLECICPMGTRQILSREIFLRL